MSWQNNTHALLDSGDVLNFTKQSNVPGIPVVLSVWRAAGTLLLSYYTSCNFYIKLLMPDVFTVFFKWRWWWWTSDSVISHTVNPRISTPPPPTHLSNKHPNKRTPPSNKRPPYLRPFFRRVLSQQKMHSFRRVVLDLYIVSVWEHVKWTRWTR